MDLASLHSVINHFPVVLTVVAAATSLAALALRSRVAWQYVFVTLALAGLSAYPALLTGEKAGDVIEKRWFASEALVDEHEEAADLALYVDLAAGALAAFGLWSLRKTGKDELPVAWLRGAVVVAALASAGATGRAGWEGGKIVVENPKIANLPGAAALSAPAAAESDHK
jgi:uncharacterized membrane protein